MSFPDRNRLILQIVITWLLCWIAVVLSIFARALVIRGFMDCGDPGADFMYAPCAQGLRLAAYYTLGYAAMGFFVLPVFTTILTRRRHKHFEFDHVVHVSDDRPGSNT